MACFIVIFFLNYNKLSSHMDQISDHINSSNHKICSYDKMRRIIVNLGSKQCKNNNNFTCQLNHLQNSLLISISDTPEKDISNVHMKLDKRTIRTSSIKSLSTLLSCLICAMCNRVHFSQNKRLMLM